MSEKEYKQQLLNDLYKPYLKCTGCHFGLPPATQIVFGEGTPNSPLVFIGEAPGRDEDIQGRPFVGRSGKLLDRIINASGSNRTDVFITNIVKIRPPNNRKPTPQEIAISKPLLLSQLKIIRPKIICTLGSAALEGLLDQPVKMTQMRGKPIKWHSITVLPTFHPAYILRNPKELKTLIADIHQAIQLSS